MAVGRNKVSRFCFSLTQPHAGFLFTLKQKIMATINQDRIFAELMTTHIEASVSTNSLDEAISWIGSNLNPDDVFANKDLESWAESNGWTKE